MSARLAAVLLVLGLLPGCMGVRYIPQAASGQLDLMVRGRKIEKVVKDARTPPDVAALLAEVAPVRDFAAARGLRLGHSYRRYVPLDREYAVWFVTGSDPLAFEPQVYWFPIAGSFAGVGWFKERRATRHVARLERRGLDAASRGASAYSTGGWFRDPVVSTMFFPGPAGRGDFVNTLLHESLHATVLIPDQTTFNESLASFVADTMTAEYLAARFGAGAPELTAWEAYAARARSREARVLSAYDELAALYASALEDRVKLAQKRAILAQLAADLELEQAPNNASLLGAKLYGTGSEDLRALLDACDHDWPAFLAAVGSLRPAHFGVAQREDIGPVVQNLVAWRCQPLPRR